MTLLAIDTATTNCVVGLSSEGFVDARVLDRDRRHVEVLTPGLVALLAERGLELSHVTKIVVDRGPGLFTGLRVGLATAQALADALNVPIAGTTSLEMAAHAAHAAGVRGDVLALVDGRRSEVFAQPFHLTDDVVARDAPTVRTPNDVAIQYGTNGAQTTLVGDGAERYAELLLKIPSLSLVELSAESLVLAQLVLGVTREPGDVSPLYLREADAVANFTTRNA